MNMLSSDRPIGLSLESMFIWQAEQPALRMKICSQPRNLPAKLLAADDTALVCERVEQGTHLLASWCDVSLKKFETVKGSQSLPGDSRP